MSWASENMRRIFAQKALLPEAVRAHFLAKNAANVLGAQRAPSGACKKVRADIFSLRIVSNLASFCAFAEKSKM